MRINLNFVNTGLDDRIVKSLPSSTPTVKTEKMVFVHDKKKGDYYRKQKVNVQQPEQVKQHSSNPEDTTSTSSKSVNPVYEFRKNLANLLLKLHKETDTRVRVSKLKVSEDDSPFLTKDLQRMSWSSIRNLTETKSYDGYTVLKGEGAADYVLGGRYYEKSVGMQPGASRYKKYDDSLTNYEATSIGGYTYSKWTYRLNNYYRGLSGEGVKLPEGQDERDVVATMAINLDSAIEKYDLEKPLVVYRTVRMSALNNILSNGDGTFRDKSFSSTTVIRDGFNLGNEPSVIMVIKVPAGKGHGAWVKPISEIPDENEFLLARGSMFNIDSIHVEFDKNGNPINAVMEAQVIGHAPDPIEPPQPPIDYMDYVDICSEEDPPEEDDDDYWEPDEGEW